MKNNLDIAAEMLKNLDPRSKELSLKNDNIKLALTSLNKAASLMDDLEFTKMAEIVTQIIENVANDGLTKV